MLTKKYGTVQLFAEVVRCAANPTIPTVTILGRTKERRKPLKHCDPLMGWRKKLRKARQLHRPSLKNWECDGLYDDFPAFVKDLEPKSEHFRSFTPCHNKNKVSSRYGKNHCGTTTAAVTPSCVIPVTLDARTLTPNDFWEKYEATSTPCIILNIPGGYDGAEFKGEWPAVRKWDLLHLEQSALRERFFKCGEDDDGKKVKVRLKYFLRYLDQNRDDSPLYIFDASFDNDYVAKSMLQDYTVPTYFRDDLFRFVSESRRPPYRWVLVGPERSGSTVHIDPLNTNAWNTLLHGQKRWVLFPPHVSKSIVKGRGVIRKDEDDEAIHYFMTILPRIKAKAAASIKDNRDYHGFACYEFTQNAGETVFVPHGWWHAVLNLTATVGVTQNFCSPRNFEYVWLKARTSRKRMAWKWLCQLDEHYPQLAERARTLNARDRFVMKYDPETIKRTEQERTIKRMRHDV